MKIRFLRLFLIIFVMIGCFQKHEPTKTILVQEVATTSDRKAVFVALDTLIPSLLEKFEVPSITVSYIEDATVAWSGVFGQRSPGVKADTQTLYLCASITKPLTTEVFLRLVDQGKVSLDEPMYPDFVDPDIKNDPRAKLLTPKHVLTHQTGFPNWRRMTGGVLKFVNDPGTQMGYSGEGFYYLVRFVEQKMGKPFNEIAQEVLFDPLGMENSALSEQAWYEDRLAWPKFPNGDWVSPRTRKEAFGAGGLFTTSEDYAHFLISIMKNEGVSLALRNQQFSISLNQKERCLSSSSDPKACPEHLGFGLGWYIYDFEEEPIVGHTGANLGERTLAVFYTEKK
ncbi:MAG: serine hydrolase [Bacteroidota bacterium]